MAHARETPISQKLCGVVHAFYDLPWRDNVPTLARSRCGGSTPCRLEELIAFLERCGEVARPALEVSLAKKHGARSVIERALEQPAGVGGPSAVMRSGRVRSRPPHRR